MLTAIRLGNFKAFGDTQSFPIKPLTLIFGANSAGKSSLIHGLLLACHAAETGELDTHRTRAGGDSVDLGGFVQYVHRHEVGRRVEWGAEIDPSGLSGRVGELLAPIHQVGVGLTIGLATDDYGEPMRGADPAVMSYEITADGESFARMSRRLDGALRLDRLQHRHPMLRTVLHAVLVASSTTEQVSPEDEAALDRAIDEMLPEILIPMGNFLPTGRREDVSMEDVALFPISRGNRNEDLANAARFALPRTLGDLIGGLHDAVTAELARLNYLGPLRSYPPRHLAFAQYHDPNWFAGGGYAWDVVRRDERVRAAVNAWLSAPGRLQTPYELRVRELVGLDQLERPIYDALDNLNAFGLTIASEQDREDEPADIYPAIEDLDTAALAVQQLIADADIEKLRELILVDTRVRTTVSHRDVGIGVSQVLPVLVQAYAGSHQINAIEQPEIHLHPGLQAELADVFIESALGGRGNTFLLETHSEHLILRIMRRMRETARRHLPDGVPAVRPKDVAVIFVERAEGDPASVARELRLDEEGDLIDEWPGGFFEEGYRETFAAP